MNKTIIASLIGLLFSPTIFAANNSITTEDIVVTASRFAETALHATANIDVITKEDIQDTPSISIPDLLKTRANINVVPLYGNQGIDATVDIRGFGDAATSNTLILLDGQRLNSVDSSNIQWAAIPLQALERIEIIRGGGSVLFGDRASGGVINLITDKSGKPSLSATATIGSYGYKSIDGYFAGGNDSTYFNTYLHSADSNGWRENSASNQLSISGRGGLNWATNETFIDYSVYRSANGLPGSIDSQTYRTDPRLARNPSDSQVKDGYRLRPGISFALTNNLRFDSEVAITGEDQHFNDVSFTSTFDRNLHSLSFTPRLHWQHGLGDLESTTVAGFDYYFGRISSDSSSYASQNARQTSNAVYLQNVTAFNKNLDLNVGMRTQNMNQRASQEAYPAFFLPAFNGSSSRTKSVYDLSLNYHTQKWSTYAKLGSSFRFANTDELFGFDAFTGNPVFAGDIKPQYGRNMEIGGSFNINNVDGKVAIYRTDISDEIGFDSSTFSNVNFDPTRHEGLEAELGWRITEQWRTRFSYAYTNAEFRNGVNEGKRLPSVSENKATAQLTWMTPSKGNYTAQINYVGSSYVSGDFANALNKQPSYTTIDLKANWDIKPLHLALTALNIFDKRYSSFTLFSNFKNDYFFFPADARSIYLSARYDFK